jgi:hypothetical protein
MADAAMCQKCERLKEESRQAHRDWMFYRPMHSGYKPQSRFVQICIVGIARAIGVSRVYVARIRRGNRPHPRRWQALAELVRFR